MKTGWIKLYRQIEENPMYFSEPFTRIMAWIDLLLLANHKPATIYVRGNRVDVGVGQIARSKESLSQRWQWSRGKTERYLLELEKAGQIEQQKSNVITLISISNYEDYQNIEQQIEQQTVQQIEQQIEQQTDINKNDKNVENVKNDKNINFSSNKLDDKSKNEFSTGSPVSYDSLITYFNEKTNGIFGIIRLPISEKRKGMIRARIREYGEQSFREVIDKASASSFLKGQNARSWKMSFDWMIKPTNYDKILSGNYDNRKSMTVPDINKLFDDD